MPYNRWMPRKYYSGGELYHYGVKGMKWKNHTYASRPDQNGSTGGAAYDPEHPAPGSFAAEEAQYAYDKNALYRASLKYKEARKPSWQKKWEKSSVRQELWKIKQKIKKRFNIQTVKYKPQKKKKSRIKTQHTAVVTLK